MNPVNENSASWALREFIKPKKQKSNVIEGNVYTDSRFRAQEFLKSQPLHYDINGLWWKWNKDMCYWEFVEDDIEILNYVYSVYPSLNLISHKTKSETLEGLKQESRKRKPSDIKSSWVQYGTKIYDIETNEVFTSTPQYFNTNPIFVKVGECEDTPIIDKLFRSWVKEEDVELLYEKIAFITIPKMIIHTFDILYGIPGTGKSTYTNLVEEFIGKHNTTATSIERINSNPRFETIKWHKKLLIKISEVSNINDLRNSAIINNATGEDSLTAERKGGRTFEFTNYGKFLNPTNKLIQVEGNDGFGRRARILNFNNRFEKEKDVLKEIPKWEFQNLAFKCLRLANKLWTTRQFTGDVSITQRMLNYQEISKTLLQKFIDKYCDISDSSAKCIFDEFYSRFNLFQKEQNEQLDSKIDVGRKLRDLKFDNRRANWPITIEQQRLNGSDLKWESKNTIFGLQFKIA